MGPAPRGGAASDDAADTSAGEPAVWACPWGRLVFPVPRHTLSGQGDPTGRLASHPAVRAVLREEAEACLATR